MDQREYQQIIDALAAHSAAHDTPEKARAYLYSKLGTHNRDGSLTEEYGGTATDDDHPVHRPPS